MRKDVSRMKKVLATIFTLSTLAVMLVNIVMFALDNAVYSLDDLPRGTVVTTTAHTDLDKPYAVSFYRIDAGGTLGTAFRAEATDLNTGHTYNVYWDKETEDGPTGMVYAWLSDKVMVINGHSVELSEDGNHYDFRVSARTDDTLPNGLRAKNTAS